MRRYVLREARDDDENTDDDEEDEKDSHGQRSRADVRFYTFLVFQFQSFQNQPFLNPSSPFTQHDKIKPFPPLLSLYPNNNSFSLSLSHTHNSTFYVI